MPDNEINYGFGVDYFALYALGNAWIRLGDELHERTIAMGAAVSGMQWSGTASTSMRSAWGAGDVDTTGVTALLYAARDNAYEIGGAIHEYARRVREAEKKADDARIVGIITWAVGAFLMGALGGIGHIAMVGRAFLLIDRTIGRLSSVIARMVPNTILGPGGRSVLERVLGYSTSTVLGAGTSLASDIAVDVAAHKIMGLEWKPDAFQIGLSVGLGAVFGAAGYQSFRHEHVPGAGGPVRQWGQGPRWNGPAQYARPLPGPAPVAPRPLALWNHGVPVLDPHVPAGTQSPAAQAPRGGLLDVPVRTRYPDGPEGVAARTEDWRSFEGRRDSVYRDRLAMEEAFNHRTGDRIDRDVETAFGTVRRNAPETGAVFERSPDLRRQVDNGYRGDLNDSFRTAWQARVRDGQVDRSWDASWRLEADRLRTELPDRIAHVADRARRLDQFDTVFDRAVSQFRSSDLFRGSYLPRSSPDPVVRFDEATGTFVAHRAEGPLDRLRAAERARVEAALDGAWRAAGNRRPTGEHAEAADARIADVQASLPDHLARLSDQERHVWHAERDFSSAHDTWNDSPWDDSPEGVGLRQDTLEHTRQMFIDDVRQRHDALDPDRPTPDGRSWEREYGSLLSDLPARFDRSAFREHVLTTGQRTLDDALATHESLTPLEPLSREQRERVAAQWRKDLERAADEHLTHGGQSWPERHAQLQHDLPRQIRHELNKDDALRVAANDFHRLAGNPDDDLTGARADIPAQLRDELAASFRTSTMTRYDQIWAPRDVDTQAWLAHEAAGTNTFGAALARARLTPAPPAARATPTDAPTPTTASPTRQDGMPARQDDTPAHPVARTQEPVTVTPETSTVPRADSGVPEAARSARQTQTQLVPEAPARLSSAEPTVTPAPRQEPVTPARADALDRPAGTPRGAEPQPVRTAAYLEEFDHALLSVPRYAYGEAAHQIYTERLTTLRRQYVEARVAADAHGPARAAEVDELRQGAAIAARHLNADSGRVASAVSDFRDRYVDLPPGVSRGSRTHLWYARELDGVIDDFRTALVDRGHPADARLEEHFRARASTLQVLARTGAAQQHLGTPGSSSWRDTAWQVRREELDTAYAAALDKAAAPHAQEQVLEQVLEQVPEQVPELADDAAALRSAGSAEQTPDRTLLERYGERLGDSFDRSVAAVEALLSERSRPGTTEQNAAPGRELLVALDVTDADLATAAEHLRARADRDLRTAVVRFTTAEVPSTAAVDRLDEWLAYQVDLLPAALVVEAARRAAVRDARSLADSIARGWDAALPVAGRPFVEAFDARSGALSDDLRRAVAERYADEAGATFAEMFHPLLVAREGTALRERLVEWAGFVRTASDRMDRALPVARAAQQVVPSAAALFDARTAGLGSALTTQQRDRLRQEFVSQARTAHAEAFAGHTGEASDLTGRTWLWQASLDRLAQRLPDRAGFEALASDSLRDAGASYRSLTRDHGVEIDIDRLETLAVAYRQDWFHAVRTLWGPPDLSETWLEQEERTDDAFTAGLTGLAAPDWRKSTRSVPAHEGEPVYCLEAAPLLVPLSPSPTTP